MFVCAKPILKILFENYFSSGFFGLGDRGVGMVLRGPGYGEDDAALANVRQATAECLPVRSHSAGFGWTEGLVVDTTRVHKPT